jgi:hypothetical protein
MFLLAFHSALRWLVLIVLLFSISRAAKGYFTKAVFTNTDNALRHWTATIAHIQLVIGMTLYLRNPLLLKYSLFFRVIHISCMFTAVIFLTVGSAMAKRQPTDTEKFRTMLLWFTISLIIILMAIPWPFSPLASRPLLRSF